ncbi:MAG: putative ATP:guanido phosphotransferase [Firmicutes bacterium ADurb.Bin182]|nr:MAG: putative ATP:guanido phosphotransferase [Firmicutes bacterium ADurb.Bin182]
MPLTNETISCRVRLARNVKDLPFVHNMSLEQADLLINRVNEAINSNGEYKLLRMVDVGDNDRLLLVERHLCSIDLAKSAKGALLLNEDESISIMVNEEDHIRIQCILPGLDLERADELSSGVDSIISKKLEYAFDAQLGFLTACPTNVGTGMRASAMVHLPALSLAKQSEQILAALSKFGIAVRGFYGEGSAAPGHIYQLSNQMTLGLSENEIIANLTDTISRLCEQEEQVRNKINEKGPVELADLVSRSFGLCRYARRMALPEFMEHMSNLKLGVSCGIIEGISHEELNALITAGQSASLRAREGKLLSEAQENIARANLVREKVAR